MNIIRIKHYLITAISQIKIKTIKLFEYLNNINSIYLNKIFFNLKKNYQKNSYLFIGITIGILLILILGFIVIRQNAIIESNKSNITPIKPPEKTEHVKKHQEETPPETFVFLEFFSELLESSVGGIGVKIAELTPKVQHINEMYQHGEKDLAFAKALGIATEVVLLGFFIETFGIGEIFISALSFQDNWPVLLGQSLLGVMLATKVALFLGEKVEESVEHKYQQQIAHQHK